MTEPTNRSQYRISRPRALLIQEPPLQVLPSLACEIGLDEAIALQQLHYWLDNPKNAGRIEGGFKWVYNTYSEWQQDNFPFWKEGKVKQVFLSLEAMGLVISAQLDAHLRDMRKFYRIDYDKLGTLHGMKNTSSISNFSPDVNIESETTNFPENERESQPAELVQYDFDEMTVNEAYKVPGLKIYYKATGFFPGRPTWKYVHETVTENKLTAARIKPIFELWCAKGYRQENVSGILGVVLNGWESDRRAAKPQTAPQGKPL